MQRSEYFINFWLQPHNYSNTEIGTDILHHYYVISDIFDVFDILIFYIFDMFFQFFRED